MLAVAILGVIPTNSPGDEKQGPGEDIPFEDQNWQVPVTLGGDGWMLYKNQRFGFVLPVPPGMHAAPPPTNGDGQGFHSLDGHTHLVGSGCFNLENSEDIEVRWKEELAEEGRTITYKKKTETWFVISGIEKGGTLFYLRHTSDENYCALWSITYPKADEKKVAEWIDRISKDYEPGLGKGDDKLE
jgi:hypothetical protein